MFIPHLEDLILYSGTAGAQKTISTLKALSESAIPVSVKWDGAPAIVAGTNPENGQFFVGTKKAVLSKNPNLCYSYSDIEDHYPWDHCDDLRHKLRAALTYLRELKYPGIFQGDLLFAPNTQNNGTIVIDGNRHVDYFEFTPNTITYRLHGIIDAGWMHDQPAIGLAVHTRLEGKIGNLTPCYDIKVSDFKPNKDVLLFDGSYDNRITIPLGLETGIKMVCDIINAIDPQFLIDLPSQTKFTRLFYDFICDLANRGQSIWDLDATYGQLINFQLKKFEQKPIVLISSLQKREQFIEWMVENESSIQFLIMYYYSVAQCKKAILAELNRNSPVETLIDGNPSGHEGFIVDGVKLVDRSEFTFQNHVQRIKKDIASYGR